MCKICGGDLILMGGLGNLKWFSCRNCGMQFSKKIKSKRKVKNGR